MGHITIKKLQLILLFSKHSVDELTTAYMRKAGAHTSTMPEASIGYF